MDWLTIAQQLLHHLTKDKNILYVLCPFNIGDFLVNGGLCHALLKKKRKQACILIVQDRFANCGLNFVGVMEVRCIPNMLMNFIKHYVYATGEYETDNYIFGNFHMKQNVEDWNNVVWNINLSFMGNYKENVFGLPLDTELIPPIIEEITDSQKRLLHEKYVLDKERTIILIPYSSSMGKLEESFCMEIISKLKKKNDYVFYTNTASPNEKIIPGTLPIVTSFQELTYIADKVKCFIGIRSGIFDLLALTNARLLYINRTFPGWNGDLNINFNHMNSKPFYLLLPYAKSYMQDFMEQNNLNSIDDLIFYNYISGKDIYFDEDSLIEKIVSEVD